MRILIVLLTVGLMTLTGCKDRFQVIGKFEATVGRDKISFPSYRDTKMNRGGIKFNYSGDDKIMFFNGLAGDFVNGMPDLPMLAVTYVSNDNGIQLRSIILHKKMGIRTAQNLFYRSNATVGKQWASQLQLDEQGNASFSFEADLVLINVDTNKPVEGDSGIHVKGRFSGVVPEQYWGI
jgi:hypothetical protein